ncbi:MAG: LysR family transcriptional regulator [Robiginitomaculum sp.]|nr:MAG: LysR family transcriptional regulator [Robiginitomaculum sp.]
MKDPLLKFDWNQARAFLATVEKGSLSAAARYLGKRQPTISRQVAGLEESLGIVLFERVGRSLVLTTPGIQLFDHFKSMGHAAKLVTLAAAGQSQALEGRVSITATNVLATEHLPPILKIIRKQAPGIVIDIHATDQIRDLMRREADIALRHNRPEGPELIGKLIAEIPLQLYASSEYLSLRGYPKSIADLSEHDFIGFERPEILISYLKNMGVLLESNNVNILTQSGTLVLSLIKEGLGIGIISKKIAEKNPNLEIVLPAIDTIKVPLWLVSHRELRTSQRIRFVFDILSAELPKIIK